MANKRKFAVFCTYKGVDHKEHEIRFPYNTEKFFTKHQALAYAEYIIDTYKDEFLSVYNPKIVEIF